MKMRGKIIYIILLGLIVIGATFWMDNHVYNDVDNRPLVAATLDLSNWPGDQIDLTGEWWYYPNTRYNELLEKSNLETTEKSLKNVPHNWEKDADLEYSPYGVCTYRSIITGLDPSEIYGFLIYDEVTAYNLYINGKLVASNGSVAHKIPEWRPVIGAFVSNDHGQVEMVMEISNDHYYRGGFWNSIEIGRYDIIFKSTQHQHFLSTFVIASLLVMGLFFLGVFMTHFKRLELLYFAFVCITMGLYNLLIVERLIHQLTNDIPWDILVRLEYALGYMLLPLFCLFLLRLFSIDRFRVLENALVGITIVLGLIPMVLDNDLYTFIFLPYKYLSVICIVIISLLLLRAISKGYKGSYLMLTGCTAVIIALIKEIEFPSVYSYMPLAGLTMFFCFSLILIENFADTIRRNEALERRAEVDVLTGLYNRQYLLSTIETFIESDQEESAHLLFMDLDGFKHINDTYGHHIGDKILVTISERLKDALQWNDVFARFGGDEFVIVAHGRTRAEIKALARHLIEIVSREVITDKLELRVGVSIGISLYKKGYTSQEWIAKGDQAMYQSKRSGRNQYTLL